MPLPSAQDRGSGVVKEASLKIPNGGFPLLEIFAVSPKTEKF